MVPDALLNPFGIDPASEFPFAPADQTNWTEHYFFHGYDRAVGHGMCVHIGRLPADPTIWRAVIQIFLPDGELFVAKYHGRDGDGRGAGAGPFKLNCIEPLRRWQAVFDGAAFPTRRESLIAEVMRDGPAEPVSFDLVFDAAGPIFGKHQDMVEGRSSSSFHSEQIVTVTGTIAYRGKTVTLSGQGARDHSSGPRDYGPVVSDIWFQSLFPSGKAIQTQIVRFEETEIRAAYVYRGDGTPLEMAEIVEHPTVNRIDTPEGSTPCDPMAENDGRFRIVLRTSQGLETIEGQLLHSHAITYASPMEEFIGTAVGMPGGLQMCECPAVVTCNGETGTALRERVARTTTLTRG